MLNIRLSKKTTQAQFLRSTIKLRLHLLAESLSESKTDIRLRYITLKLTAKQGPDVLTFISYSVKVLNKGLRRVNR